MTGRGNRAKLEWTQKPGQPLIESQHFQKFISLIPNSLTSRPLIYPRTRNVSYNCKEAVAILSLGSGRS